MTFGGIVDDDLSIETYIVAFIVLIIVIVVLSLAGIDFSPDSTSGVVDLDGTEALVPEGETLVIRSYSNKHNRYYKFYNIDGENLKVIRPSAPDFTVTLDDGQCDSFTLVLFDSTTACRDGSDMKVDYPLGYWFQK